MAANYGSLSTVQLPGMVQQGSSGRQVLYGYPSNYVPPGAAVPKPASPPVAPAQMPQPSGGQIAPIRQMDPAAAPRPPAQPAPPAATPSAAPQTGMTLFQRLFGFAPSAPSGTPSSAGAPPSWVAPFGAPASSGVNAPLSAGNTAPPMGGGPVSGIPGVNGPVANAGFDNSNGLMSTVMGLVADAAMPVPPSAMQGIASLFGAPVDQAGFNATTGASPGTNGQTSGTPFGYGMVPGGNSQGPGSNNAASNTTAGNSSNVGEGGNPSGGGSGSGGKVICTECWRQGYLPQSLIADDDRYAAWLRANRPGVYEGYRLWAEYIVAKMRRSPAFTARIAPIVRACAEEMGRRARGEKGPFAIRASVSIGERACVMLYRLAQKMKRVVT